MSNMLINTRRESVLACHKKACISVAFMWYLYFLNDSFDELCSSGIRKPVTARLDRKPIARQNDSCTYFKSAKKRELRGYRKEPTGIVYMQTIDPLEMRTRFVALRSVGDWDSAPKA